MTKLIVLFANFIKRRKALFTGKLHRRCALLCSSTDEHTLIVQKDNRSI